MAKKGNDALKWGLGATAIAVVASIAFAGGEAEAAPAGGGGGGDSGGGGGSGAGSIVFPVYSSNEGAAMLEDLTAAEGLDDDWVRWFLAVARGESRFTSNVVLGARALYPVGSVPSPLTDTLGPREAAGAVTAYERARSQGRLDCPWGKDAYTWGSGGWLGQIPANAWAAYKGTQLACRHPWYLLHPVDQVITAIEYLRRLSGWSAYKADPTLLTARVGWGNPSAMDSPAHRERVATEFAADLDAIGLPADFASRPAPAFPPKRDVYERWGALMRRFDFDPGAIGPS